MFGKQEVFPFLPTLQILMISFVETVSLKDILSRDLISRGFTVHRSLCFEKLHLQDVLCKLTAKHHVVSFVLYLGLKNSQKRQSFRLKPELVLILV